MLSDRWREVEVGFKVRNERTTSELPNATYEPKAVFYIDSQSRKSTFGSELGRLLLSRR